MPPDGLIEALSWDLSPLRPWEYWRVDAREWSRAVAMRNAYDEGRRDADDDAEAKRLIEQTRPG